MATLDKVSVDIAVVLGTRCMPVHQVLRLGRGAIIELESSEDDAVTILANNLPVAKGKVVVNGNRIAVEVGELMPRPAGYALRPGHSGRLRVSAGPCPSRPYLLEEPRFVGTRGFSRHFVHSPMRPWRNW